MNGVAAESTAGARSVLRARTLAFITGCGRSGTTILGRLLEQHEEVRYFNDRFDLWVKPFAFTDIWGREAGSELARPRVELGAEDAAAPEAARSAFFAGLEHERGGKPVVVEKLAINNFRLGFLAALCPGARLVNIVRHGVEVAFSIEQRALAGRWYGQQDRKWNLLTEHARERGHGALAERCTTPYLRGLLEWRMSAESAERHFAESRGGNVLHLRYEELIADGTGVAERLRRFLGLSESERMRAFAATEFRRRTPPAREREIPALTEEIAGETLRRMGYSTAVAGTAGTERSIA